MPAKLQYSFACLGFHWDEASFTASSIGNAFDVPMHSQGVLFLVVNGWMGELNTLVHGRVRLRDPLRKTQFEETKEFVLSTDVMIFTTEVRLPADVPGGRYQVEVLDGDEKLIEYPLLLSWKAGKN